MGSQLVRIGANPHVARRYPTDKEKDTFGPKVVLELAFPHHYRTDNSLGIVRCTTAIGEKASVCPSDSHLLRPPSHTNAFAAIVYSSLTTTEVVLSEECSSTTEPYAIQFANIEKK